MIHGFICLLAGQDGVASRDAMGCDNLWYWTRAVTSSTTEPDNFPFEDAAIHCPDGTRLSASRTYTLSLSPQLIYSRSRLVPTLVSSKVYRQLEFQAVGSWWIHRAPSSLAKSEDTAGGRALFRVPGSREDVFADDTITVKSKRTLMRFLRHIGKPQEDDEAGVEEDDLSLPEYLSSKFQMPSELHDPLLSLSLSQAALQQTSVEYAVPRIKRHLASIGVFGPGFGALLAKWGGGAEVSQVGCRALAVGGGIYVLNAGINSITSITEARDDNQALAEVHLSNGETIKTKFVVGSHWDLPSQNRPSCDKVARSITVVSSPLENLFPITVEGSPVPAGAVVVFPGASLGRGDDSSPVYILAHSSDTGECPSGQSVLYSSVSVAGAEGQSLIEEAINKLLGSSDAGATVLWSLRYTQLGKASNSSRTGTPSLNRLSENVICFPPGNLDLAFDDAMIDMVKEAWKLVMGGEVDEDTFMEFEDREGAYNEE
ncbi:hypothetical protein EYZ11_001431 [Aspergillus tanneri]|uniref:Rab proteins geranylgeranyltransferase n=1 Tax=Aspergillus tanneri TaxID=1220188 RepID=A0A4V3UQH8_9EURO|nr:hypothetical protein EYZ11_001431 [Aspergillus tanneri]